ncbi:hypothetical protein [Actinoplanes sp. M2I2]|nr:hypothetical protein [Actinoplanes sp. M2I2]
MCRRSRRGAVELHLFPGADHARISPRELDEEVTVLRRALT